MDRTAQFEARSQDPARAGRLARRPRSAPTRSTSPQNPMLVALALTLSLTPVSPQDSPKPPLPAGAAVAAPDAEDLLEVVKVVDGDTIHVLRDGAVEKLRLLSVDTEERIYPGGSSSASKPQTVFGEQTGVWAEQLFERMASRGDGTARVALRFPDGEERRDVYGRLLCHVILENGQDFNLMLVKTGRSPYFNKYGNSRISHEAFVEAQERAQASRLGVWSPSTNKPASDDALAAKRPYDALLPWWDARAQALDRFRDQLADDPETVVDAEDGARLEQAIAAGNQVEVFGSIARIFDEQDGSKTVLLRSGDKERALRVTIAEDKLAAHEAFDFEGLRAEYAQNFCWVRGKVEQGPRGPVMVSASPEQWRVAEPAYDDREPEATGNARLEAMLTALGGRSRWARVDTIHSRIAVLIPGGPPLETERWAQLSEARQRIELTLPAPSGKQIWVIDGDRGWQSTAEGVAEMPQEQLAATLAQKRYQLWDVIHTLARNGGGLVARDVSTDSLHISGPSFEMLLVLDEGSRPRRVIYRAPADNKNMTYEYEGWRSVDGEVLYATKMTDRASGREWNVRSFELLSGMDRAMLDQP